MNDVTSRSRVPPTQNTQITKYVLIQTENGFFLVKKKVKSGCHPVTLNQYVSQPEKKRTKQSFCFSYFTDAYNEYHVVFRVN